MSSMGSEQRILERFMQLSIAAAVATIILKALAAWFTGSVGFLSDALESVVNLVAAVAGFYALRIAAKPADDEALKKAKIEAAMLKAQIRKLEKLEAPDDDQQAEVDAHRLASSTTGRVVPAGIVVSTSRRAPRLRRMSSTRPTTIR